MISPTRVAISKEQMTDEDVVTKVLQGETALFEIVMITTHGNAAFYLPQTRAWELGLGCMGVFTPPGQTVLTRTGIPSSRHSLAAALASMDAVAKDGEWNLYWRTEIELAKAERRAPKPKKTFPARRLWEEIADAAWSCADPGVQFSTTINEWHTCSGDEPIRASNPCSEYMDDRLAHHHAHQY